MDSQTKLTPDQIAGFEARAKNGERPALEWLEWDVKTDHPVSVPKFQAGSSIRIYRGYHLCFGVQSESGGYFRSGFFSCLLAAQLAAEHLLQTATLPLHAAEIEKWREASREKLATIAKLEVALASRDGEIAALRARVAELETVSLNGLVGDYAALRARAEAAEARARELEGLNAMEVQRLISANDAAQAREEVVSHLLARVAALEAALAESVSELMNIANVDVSRWDPIQRPEFRAWAQNRARFTLKNLEEARTALDAARAGGQG